MQSSHPYVALIRRGLDQAGTGRIDGTTLGQLQTISSQGSWSAEGYAAVRPIGDHRLVLHGPGGRMAQIDTWTGAVQTSTPAAPVAVTAVPVPPPVRFEGPEVMDRLFPIVAVVFGAITLISLGQPLVRAWVRRLERKWAGEPRPSGDLTQRFDRLEQAVEAVAIEVERIGEAHRYQARMLAERGAQEASAAAPSVAPKFEAARVRTGRTPPEGVAR